MSPIPTQPRYIDISMTFANNPVTGDVTTITDETDIQASIVNLVMTKNYESPFHPEIGCSVMSSLFENLTSMTSINIRRSIIDVLQNFEPRVVVIGVQVQADPNTNGYAVIVVYQIKGVSTSPITLNLFLKRLR